MTSKNTFYKELVKTDIGKGFDVATSLVCSIQLPEEDKKEIVQYAEKQVQKLKDEIL